MPPSFALAAGLGVFVACGLVAPWEPLEEPAAGDSETGGDQTYFMGEQMDYSSLSVCQNTSLNDVTSDFQTTLDAAGWLGHRLEDADSKISDFYDSNIQPIGYGKDHQHADAARVAIFAGHGHVGIHAWEEKARNDPYREGAVRFKLDGRDVLARYRPATDRLTISAMDTRVRPMDPATADPGIGDDAALAAARGCLTRLEELGIIGSGEFSTEPTITGQHPVQFDPETSWVERYTFMFNPILDGLRLRSAEVVIAVNAWSGICQRITVGGQVEIQRVGTAAVSLTDAEQAATLVKKKVMLDLPAVREVHVTGEFGYYLPVDKSSIVVSPMFLARYAAESGTADMPVVGRSSIAGLPLQDPAHEELVDLLGPL